MSMPRKVRCTVESITDHGGRVYSVELAPEGTVPPFRPGQFLHLTVDEYDPSGFWPESRVFSIASSPSERKRLCICYSVKGRYTTKMEQVLRAGTEVWIKLPYGEFMISETEDAVLLAGGTGISAFTAFIEGLKTQHPRQVWLVYGARDPSLLLYHEMLFERLTQVPNFHLVLFVESGCETLVSELAQQKRALLCLAGRISLDALWPHLPQPESKVFYISGPPVMLSALSDQLKTRGLAQDRIRTDAWE